MYGRNPRPGWLYFLQAGDDGPIKIGCAVNVFERARYLQCGHYEELFILGLLDGDQSQEDRLHRMFAHLNIRGEWFQPGGELKEFVSSQTMIHWEREYLYFASKRLWKFPDAIEIDEAVEVVSFYKKIGMRNHWRFLSFCEYASSRFGHTRWQECLASQPTLASRPAEYPPNWWKGVS
jgi:hypothetical protein